MAAAVAGVAGPGRAGGGPGPPVPDAVPVAVGVSAGVTDAPVLDGVSADEVPVPAEADRPVSGSVTVAAGSEARKVAASGVLMLATACPMPPVGCAERKPTAAGAGMIMPMPAAIRSIRWSSASVATEARSCWFWLCSAVLRSIERPIEAFSLSIETCIATIPVSSTPSTGIQARPRTRRSMTA